MNDIIYVQTQRYVYFDDAGNILSVSNNNTTLGNCIAVELEDIDTLLSGKEQFWHYQVIFDNIKKSYVLKHVYNNEPINLNINVDIYKVPSVALSQPDLIVQQDIKNRTWRFKLDNVIKENFRTKNMHLNSILTFSISKYNDLHQLERFIKMSINDLIASDEITIPFESEIELDENALSVYTTKRLDTYIHEVIQ
jgi:hypothetical protein